MTTDNELVTVSDEPDGLANDQDHARLLGEIERLVAEFDRLHTWIDANVGHDLQLGDTPVDHALRVMARQRLAIAHLVSDGEHIASALRDEAEQREWCDEYEAFVRRVNVGLQEMTLLPCRRKQSIELRVYVDVICAEDDLEDERQRLRADLFARMNADDEVVTVAVNIE